MTDSPACTFRGSLKEVENRAEEHVCGFQKSTGALPFLQKKLLCSQARGKYINFPEKFIMKTLTSRDTLRSGNNRA
jgi:hypothetical protein